MFFVKCVSLDSGQSNPTVALNSMHCVTKKKQFDSTGTVFKNAKKTQPNTEIILN